MRGNPPLLKVLHINMGDNSNAFLSEFTYDKTGVATLNTWTKIYPSIIWYIYKNDKLHLGMAIA